MTKQTTIVVTGSLRVKMKGNTFMGSNSVRIVVKEQNEYQLTYNIINFELFNPVGWRYITTGNLLHHNTVKIIQIMSSFGIFKPVSSQFLCLYLSSPMNDMVNERID